MTIWMLGALAGMALAEGTVHWSYSGQTGPEHWAGLSESFHECNGKNQSPIDLNEFVEADLPPLHVFYQRGGSDIVNNGHTVQVNYSKGSYITVNGREFVLKQFHFHAPSENRIDGQSYPLEVHLVHVSPNGNLAVLAVMFREGEANPVLSQAWASIPRQAGEPQPLPSPVDAAGLLPANRDYYYFNGSLTTPPCSEGVRWLVLKESIQASREQIDAFVSVLHEPNNRPVQRLNARPVLR